MGRDSEAHTVGQRRPDPFAQLLEAREGRRVPSEDLEIDDGAEARLRRRLRRGAYEAAVPDRRDPGAQALVRAVGRDRAHLVEVEQALARDVHADPRREREPVAEPGVHGVLEVGVAVDEPRDDHAALEALARPDVRRRPDVRDRSVVGDRDGAVARSGRPPPGRPSRPRAPSSVRKEA